MKKSPCSGEKAPSVYLAPELDRLKRSNLIWQTIRRIRIFAYQEKDIELLLKGICETLVAKGGYYNAWACLLTSRGKASCCVEENVGRKFIELKKRLESCNLTYCAQKALKNEQILVTARPDKICSDCPLASSYVERGAFTAPLIQERQILGLLCVSVPAKLLCDQEEKYLFKELSREVAMSIHTLQLESRLCKNNKIEAVATLSSGIAHEFNNVLAVISGGSELALDEYGDVASFKDDVESILKAVQRGKALVEQLMLFGGVKKPVLRPVDLNQIVSDALSVARYTFHKKVLVKLDLCQGLPRINGDMAQVERVILSIASNAWDAMNEGGSLEVRTKAKNLDDKFCEFCGKKMSGTFVVLEIIDNGHGMDRQIQNRMFDPFFTTKEKENGTGLGMSAVLGIVQAHNGHIECQSKIGEGTKIKIFLPSIDRVEDSANPKGISMLNETGGKKILIVDDEEALCRMGSRLLSGIGYTVDTANSGEEAIEVYKKTVGGFDCVITDLNMPGIGGERAMQAILNIDPRAKFIVSSGYIDIDKTNALQSPNIAGFLSKPFGKSELFEMLQGVLTN